jgi:threonylcarbamoyladenosine tRNA methylthiotransferase MtaB
MNFQVHTFGCKVNTYDSGLIQKNLGRAELKLDPNTKIHVLNTCAVTAEATKEAVRTIRRIKAREPFATVVVTGCAAQVDTDSFRDVVGADLIVANSHKGLLPQILDQYFKGEVKDKVFKSNIFRKEDLEMGGGEEQSHTRSFLKIQDGCNSFCTYCIIPYARGKSRSIPVAELVRRINDLSAQNINEVVLTGVHIGDYEDAGQGLEDLVEALLLKTKMPRFRLSSLEPVELTDRLVDLYQDERLCPHFHMSIQSAETETLKQMKRKYSQEDVKKALHKIETKIPGAFVGMDVITGFPTETEAQFEETYGALSELPWTRIHVFPYSERTGTRAAVMETTVPWAERLKRAQKLRELSLHRYQSEALKQQGSVKKVLLLKKETRGGAHGLSRDYWNVRLTNLADQPLVPGEAEALVRITGYEHNPKHMEGVLIGEILR